MTSPTDSLTQQILFLFLDVDVILLTRAGIKDSQQPSFFHSISHDCSERTLSIMVITYPRPCPTCGKKVKNRRAFSRHRKYCGKKTEPVPCPYCESTFKRKDDLSKHTRKFHSHAAKRKAEESAELLRLAMMYSNTVPTLSQ